MAELEIGSYEKRQNGIEAEFYSLEMLNKDKKKKKWWFVEDLLMPCKCIGKCLNIVH